MGVKPTPAKNEIRGNLRDLDIEIGFLEGVVRRDGRYIDALRLLGDDYTRRGRVNEGLKVDRRLARLCPDDPLVQYNLACSLSLVGRCRDSVKALKQAFSLGYRDIKWLRKDPDLKEARKHPAFVEIEEAIKQFPAAE